MVQTIQSSFSKGEIDPALHGRVDISAYQIGLRTARNVFIHSAGAVSNRAGTEFVGPCKEHTYAPRLIRFAFKTTDAYQLEFGDLYMRVIRNGAYVTEANKTITAVTAANPPVVTSAGHGFSNGDEVDVSGVFGMTQLNGRRFQVNNVAANTFELRDQVTHVNIDATAYTAYSSAGVAARVYTIVSPYAKADLNTLKYVQSADVMTLTHPSYAPRELSRTAHTAWTFTAITFAPLIQPPAAIVVTPDAPAAVTYVYEVTSIAVDTGEESLPQSGTTTTGAAAPANVLTWVAIAGAARYSVYRKSNGIFGLLGDTVDPTFHDTNITPNLDISPPDTRNPFSGANLYPGACTYFEQRRVFAGTNTAPDTSYYTQVGNYKNLNVSTPLQDDDAITQTMASQEVNEIRGFVPGNDLIVMTSGSEWRVNSGTDSAFSPASIKQKPQSVWGSGHHRPIVAGNTILFVTDNNASVRSLGYSLQIDGYTGVNLTLLSKHLLEENMITDWAYSASPEGLIYMTRDDGQMLCLTFNQEQQVVAWTHWDTLGSYERVSVTRHSATAIEDDVYAVVKRLINGNTVRYVERQRSRIFDDVRDCFFVDCGLSYDNPKVIGAVTLASPGVITSTAHGFSNADEIDIFSIKWTPSFDSVDNEVQPDQLNGGRFTVANATANTFTLVDTLGNPVDTSGFAAYVSGGTARKTTLAVGGLWHLEGQAIAVLADGNVVSGLTVASGIVTLPHRASRVHAGLKYIADVETLNIEAPQGTIQALKKKISWLLLRFKKSRGLFVGPDTANLTEAKWREFEDLGDPTALLTGDKRIDIPPSWNTNGRIFMRQRYPLPMTILAVLPDIVVADR